MIRSLINIVTALCAALLIFALAKPTKVDLPKEWAKHVVPFRVSIMNNARHATGFHLSYQGKTFIVTNRHVCDFNIKVFKHRNIQFGDFMAKIIAIDTLHDLCLVTSNRNEGLTLAKTQSKPLDKITLIGFPRGLGKTIREGRVMGDYPIFAPWLDNRNVEAFQISAIGYGGNSGSPILNEEGNVTGVLFAGHRYFHTEAYIVPLSYLKVFLALHAK